MRSSVFPSFRLSVLVVVGVAVACTNEGSDLGFGPLDENFVGVLIYLDRDGSRTLTGLDTAFVGARVGLLLPGGTDTFRVTNSIFFANNAAIARFERVPLAQYRVVVGPSSIGDSIEVQAVDSANIKIQFDDDTTFVLARLGYPEVSIREARALAPGKRVFLRAIVLAGVQSFRDTTSHVSDSSGYLRLTRVGLRGGLTGNDPGDSVSVLGVTSSRAGQPTLDQALLALFSQRPPPVAVAVGTGTAATAQGGLLDAALVQITGAVISDTATVAPDFRVTVSDGTGSLDVILDGNINFPRTQFRPLRSMQAKGVLVPNGVGGWDFKPRALGDVTLN